MLAWPTDHLMTSPWLSSLRPTLAKLNWHHFPAAADWSAATHAAALTSTLGAPIRFIDPCQLEQANYERRIAETGAVATRPDNWHDAFNALCWLSWPLAKVALNTLHLDELARQPDALRSRARDGATLFDESGLVLAVSDTAISDALHQHHWHTLFVELRHLWGVSVEPFAFGHALMEKSLAPFIGIVAKVLVVVVPTDWFQQALATKLTFLDQHLARNIPAGVLASPRALPPLPVLGIPGWWPEQNADFYANQRHFRPKRVVTHPR